MPSKASLDMFFKPNSIAVIGASRNPKKAGYMILQNILNTFDPKRVYPVNPSSEKIGGIKAYPSVIDIDDKNIDLAIFFVPPKVIPRLIHDCATKNVKGIIIQSAGLKEVGGEGEVIQEEIRKLGKKYNIRIWGGNSMGTITDTLVTTFLPISDDEHVKDGNVSIVGQSGYFSGAVYNLLVTERHVAIRKASSIGNRIDIDENDILEDYISDSKTKVIGVYIEGFKDPRRFLEIVKTTNKPIITLVGGRSDTGRRAALSHTASTVSGSPEVIKGLLHQAGVIPVDGFGELFTTLECFAKLPKPIGNRLTIATITGAGGVVGSDLAEKYGLVIPRFSAKTLERLQNEVYPSWMPPNNPLDLWPAIEKSDANTAITKALSIVFENNEVDMAIVMMAALKLPQSQEFDPRVLIEPMKKYQKPIGLWIVGQHHMKQEWEDKYRSAGGVCFHDIEECLSSFRKMFLFSLKKQTMENQ